MSSAIEDWDVSQVTDMKYLFHTKYGCNPNIRNWNVSSVTNLIELHVMLSKAK